jgi:branched-chain amino acid transport system ATP-binding protein
VNLINLNNIEVMYNRITIVLRGVSLQIPDGGIVTLLGGNGAGKSTTLKAISGLLHPELGEVTEGSVVLDEKRIDRLPPEEIAAMGIIQVMEGRQILEHLTVEEEFLIGAHMRKEKVSVKNDIDLIYGYFPVLRRHSQKKTGYLSGGEQQMVLIGRAFMSRPRFMLLDEPSLGLSPILVKEIFNIIYKINREQSTGIMLVEQNAKMALRIAEYGYVMENGRVVLDGAAKELSNNEDIKEFYLGLSRDGKKKSYREVKHYKRRKRWL